MRQFKQRKRREFARLRAAYHTFFVGSAYLTGRHGRINVDKVRWALDELEAKLRVWWKGA